MNLGTGEEERDCGDLRGSGRDLEPSQPLEGRGTSSILCCNRRKEEMAISDTADIVNLMVGIRSGFCTRSLFSL